MKINDSNNVSEVYFKNNGETDLLTGAVAPNVFNQLVQRDIYLSERDNSSLSIISVKMNMNQIAYDSESRVSKAELESQLISLYFKLKNFFRNSDCICRMSQYGFWILVNDLDLNSSDKLIERLSKTLPEFVEIGIAFRQTSQNLIDWYSQVDAIHFKDNLK
jgi:hypothetical protein